MCGVVISDSRSWEITTPLKVSAGSMLPLPTRSDVRE
jgi:hypothetical protein